MIRGLQVALLTGVYALTLASLHPLDLALGALLSAAALGALRRFLAAGEPSAGGLGRRAVRFPAFAAAVALEVAKGVGEVTLAVLGVRPPTRADIVSVPFGERSANGVAVSALAVTLSPGEVLVDVDWDRRVMLVHVLDASDPEAVRARHRRFYERHQRGVFP